MFLNSKLVYFTFFRILNLLLLHHLPLVLVVRTVLKGNKNIKKIKLKENKDFEIFSFDLKFKFLPSSASPPSLALPLEPNEVVAEPKTLEPPNVELPNRLFVLLLAFRFD